MNSKDSKFGRVQGARRSETGVCVLVHEDFATTKQRGNRLEIPIQENERFLFTISYRILSVIDIR